MPGVLFPRALATFPLAQSEVYSFVLTEPSGQLDWDIAAARRLIAVRRRTPRRLDTTWLAVWLSQRSHYTAGHLEHIPSKQLDEPSVLVEILVAPPAGCPALFLILIDGTHRAARRLLDGQAVWAYLLTEQEQRSICTYRRGGQIAALSSLAAAGHHR